MGVESANYVYALSPHNCDVDKTLEKLGAVKQRADPGRFDYWVLKGERYWIDFQLGSFNAQCALSIRVALCNPVDVLVVLRNVFEVLSDTCAGTLLDKQSGLKHSRWSEAAWGTVEEAYAGKQAEFQKYFGPFEAAISGSDVFETLRERRVKG